MPAFAGMTNFQTMILVQSFLKNSLAGTMTEETNIKQRNTRVIIAMVLVFLAPLLLAWYMTFTAEHGRGTWGGAQHGILINPPRALENLDLLDPMAGGKTTLYGKWTMFALIEGDCDRNCKEVLYRMRQIQIAMGENFFHVQRVVYFTGQDAGKDAKNIFTGFEGQLILARDKAGADFRKNFLMAGKSPEFAIYLIDPRGFLMMCYTKDTNPSGMIRDLHRLLRATG
jgi:hypothetical protein